MSKKNVEALLIKGGEDTSVRDRYNHVRTKEDFVSLAAEDGFEFTVEELNQVLKESGDSFDTNGNPPKRAIWWT
jgi:predicted ribosomally synthesized peptide with nif11-like leader